MQTQKRKIFKKINLNDRKYHGVIKKYHTKYEITLIYVYSTFSESAGKKLKVSEMKIPRYLQKPTLRLENGRLIMECIMEANPHPEVRWFHNNTRLQDGGRFSLKTVKQQKHLYLLVLEISVSEITRFFVCKK